MCAGARLVLQRVCTARLASLGQGTARAAEGRAQIAQTPELTDGRGAAVSPLRDIVVHREVLLRVGRDRGVGRDG